MKRDKQEGPRYPWHSCLRSCCTFTPACRCRIPPALIGEQLPEAVRFMADTVNVGPGQRYDVIWQTRKPGKWIVHCHIPHHTTNNNVEQKGAGGLTLVLDVGE